MPRKKAQPPSPDSPSAVKQRHDEAIANGDPFAFIDALQDLPGPLLNWTNEFRHLRQIIRHRNQSDPRKFAEEVLSNGIGTLADFALRIGFYARCQMAKVDSAFRGHSQDSLPPGVGGLITKLTEIYSQLSVLLERQASVARMWALADAKNAETVLQRRNGLHRGKRSMRATGALRGVSDKRPRRATPVAAAATPGVGVNRVATLMNAIEP